MAEDVGKGSVQMAFELYFGQDGGRPVGGAREGLNFFSAALDDFFGVASKEDFADELGLVRFGVREMPGGVKSIG